MCGTGVVLGSALICDGFADGIESRAQTHNHADHMEYFDRSKGRQQIYGSPATMDLLLAHGDPALKFRTNLRPVDFGEAVDLGDNFTMQLLPSGHMLGSSQVLLVHPDGYRTGYSGDFQTGLADIIEVNELVVDSTYGGLRSRRQFSEKAADESLQELFCSRYARGPVVLKAHRGLMPRVLELLVDVSYIESIALTPSHDLDCRASLQYGWSLPDWSEIQDNGVGQALDEGAMVVGTTLGNRLIPENTRASVICVRRAWTHKYPILQVNDRVWHAGLSAHADLDGTLDFVVKSGAELVLTDNVRGGSHGVELAQTIRQELGVESRPCPHRDDYLWGSGS